MTKKKSKGEQPVSKEPVVESAVEPVQEQEICGLSFLVQMSGQTPLAYPALVIQGVDDEEEAIRMFLNENGLWSQGDCRVEVTQVSDEWVAQNEEQAP